MGRVNACYPNDALSTVNIHRAAAGQTSGVGGQPTSSNTRVLTGLTAMVQKLTGRQAEQLFGLQSQSRWAVEFDADVTILANDLVVVSTGPYAGTIIEIEDITIPLGELKLTQCNDTKRVLA